VTRIAAVAILLLCGAASAQVNVTLVHFADYHSHAVPFYSEEREDQGGIARAIGYLQRQKRHGALVFSGGDMINKGAPAWSDKFVCAEWPWLNGIVDAMAFGNHEPDYTFAEFVRCRDSVRYPILSANTEGFPRSAIFTTRGVRIGVFALAGPDFPALVKVPELRFTDRLAAAREVVADLRERQRADAVVLIGHEHAEDDFALARMVPGIDVIFGTHSHLKQPMMKIPGTETWFISPFQYLTYISRVDLTIHDHRVIDARGELVRIYANVAADRKTVRRVQRMQRELERDPRFRELFVTFARMRDAMTVDQVADYTVETMRESAVADVALATASTFRQPLPAGPLDLELLRNALPYDNEIVTAEVPLSMLERVLAYGKARGGTDAFAYVAGSVPREKQSVRVATTDYLARVAPGYRDLFHGLPIRSTGLRMREEVRKRLARDYAP
jgi:5'-nucleotidase/UDP-sugar diphosphatase